MFFLEIDLRCWISQVMLCMHYDGNQPGTRSALAQFPQSSSPQPWESVVVPGNKVLFDLEAGERKGAGKGEPFGFSCEVIGFCAPTAGSAADDGLSYLHNLQKELTSLAVGFLLHQFDTAPAIADPDVATLLASPLVEHGLEPALLPPAVSASAVVVKHSSLDKLAGDQTSAEPAVKVRTVGFDRAGLCQAPVSRMLVLRCWSFA